MTQVIEGPDGGSLAVQISGAPPGKHTVFLLHGTPGSLHGPRPRGIFLHRLGIRLITYNRPGYPGSTRRIHRTVADAAADVAAIADHFNIREFSVIGRSGGAPHALACAAAGSLRERVNCVAALSGLAPYDAEGLDWFDGMAESNKQAYHDVRDDLDALITTLNEHAGQVRNNPQGLLSTLWPELADADREVIGDIALRRIIAQTHAEALRESIAGWVDDVVALGRPWGFDLSDITVPVLLWHGGDDVFSPVAHTMWLAKRIETAELELRPNVAHFGAVETLPEILRWVLRQVGGTTSNRDAAWAGDSEWLRVDDAQQSLLAGRRRRVRMLPPKQHG